MSLPKSLIVIVFFVGASATASGQAAQSIFTSFGVGDMWDPAQANVQGMAGVGISNPQYWYINNLNPALLVFNNYTTFQTGLIGETRTATNGLRSQDAQDGNMNYLMLGFPIKPGKWTTSISLTPYSTVDYSFGYVVPVEN